MILHLLTDDKFADYAIAQFSAPEMQSDFVLIPSNNVMHLVKHIDRCMVVKPFSSEFEVLLNRLDQYSAIVFHGLFWGRWQTPILQHVPESVKVAWYFWGGEIYSRHEFDTLFMAPITLSVYRVRDLVKRVKKDATWEVSLSLYGKIDYCMTSMREECDKANELTKLSFKHLWYTYYSLEETIGSLMNDHCEGNNIWIGNSAALKNNHLDVLWKIRLAIKRSQFGKNKIIIPLSYGEKWVGNFVAKISRWLFGERVNILDTFMPREEYNQLMLSCSTMILGYLEPAGQGNIITGLWLGMRVYLSEQSLAYAYYKRIGAKVYALETDLKTYGFTPLSEEERAENRKVLNQWYSKEHVEQAVKDVVYELR